MLDDIQATLLSHGYSLLESIGSGASAQVFKAIHNTCQEIYAIKIITLETAEDKTIMENAYANELKTLSLITHPNIVKVYKSFQDANHLYMVLEYCPNGSLAKYIKNNGPFENNRFLQLAVPLLKAINYLHEHKIIHGDIKPENILFDENNVPKLVDFGLASVWKDKSELKKNFFCSVAYASPEQIFQRPYDPYKADIWSFGATCYYMATGRLLFQGKNMSEIMQLANGSLGFMDNDNVFLGNILCWTLAFDPQLRLSAGEILSKKMTQNAVQQIPLAKYHTDCFDRQGNRFIRLNVNKSKTLLAHVGSAAGNIPIKSSNTFKQLTKSPLLMSGHSVLNSRKPVPFLHSCD